MIHSLPLRARYMPYNSLCPFLYQTSTIQTIRSAIGTISATQHSGSAAGREFHQTTRSQKEPHAQRPPAESIQSFLKQRAQEAGSDKGPKPQRLLTKAERRAVRALRRLGSSRKPQQQAVVTSDPCDLDIDNILELFAPQGRLPLSKLQAQPDAKDEVKAPESHESAPLQAQTLHATAQTYQVSRALLMQIQSHRDSLIILEGLAPDIATWRTSQTLIFPLLNLFPNSYDQPPLNTTTVQLSKTIPSSLAALITRDTPIVPLLSTLYPAATLLFLRYMFTHTPTSKLLLSYLHEIRAQGRISDVLAANVHFYNVLFLVRWRIYGDLAGVATLLDDMRAGGVQANLDTMAVLREIEQAMKMALRDGADGENRSNWSAQFSDEDVARLFGPEGWKALIVKQMRWERKAVA